MLEVEVWRGFFNPLHMLDRRELGLFDEGIQFWAAPDVEPPKPLEEIPKLLHG